MHRLRTGIRSEKCIVVRMSKSVLTQTLKPGIDLASLWMNVLSDIRFENGEVSSILKICSGK